MEVQNIRQWHIKLDACVDFTAIAVIVCGQTRLPVCSRPAQHTSIRLLHNQSSRQAGPLLHMTLTSVVEERP